MLNSFTYMFKDKFFWKKYLLLYVFILIANFLMNSSSIFAPILNNGKTSCWYYILMFAGFVAMFIPYGYSITLLKLKLKDKSATDMPTLDIKENFMSGLKVVVSGTLLVLIVAAISFLTIALNITLSKLFGDFISTILNILLFLALLTIGFLGISMCCRYVIKPSYLNFINFKAATELINYNVPKYFKAFLLTLLSMIVVYTLALLPVKILTDLGYIGLIIYCIWVSILWSYQIFILAGLFENAVIAEKI